MSKADQQFVTMCRDILDHGTTTEGQKVRPVWEDGTPAYTIKNFGVTARYELREEFPALTLRRTALKAAMDEILWIYQKKSNNVHDLNSHIWDEWADETGSIGKAYGYQIGQKSHYAEGDFDQMDRVLYDLKNTPYSRRIMTNTYVFSDLSEMHLYPCAYSVTYNVTQRPQDDKPTLNMILNQRSQDILAANNWNVCQYAILLMMVAQSVNMIPGELLHVIADAHIYDRHVDIVRELIERPQFAAPKVTLNPDVHDFYAFTTDDLIVEGYEHGPQVKNIPIAVLSFPGGRPLKNRRNIVLTRDDSFAPEGVDVVHSVDEALAAVADEPVAWVIGGGEVYRQFLPYCVEAEVTHNHCVYIVDTHFPDLEADPAWEIAQRSGVAAIAAGEGDEGIDYEFVTYRRIEA